MVNLIKLFNCSIKRVSRNLDLYEVNVKHCIHIMYVYTVYYTSHIRRMLKNNVSNKITMQSIQKKMYVHPTKYDESNFTIITEHLCFYLFKLIYTLIDHILTILLVIG